MKDRLTILQGDCLDQLRTLPDESVQCCVTSPPYWGLRDYGCDGQIGLERTPEEYVAKMVAVFAEVRRVLRKDGTCWVNLGDSYCSTDKWGGGKNGNTGKHTVDDAGEVPSWAVRAKRPSIEGVKPKDLIGIPWRVAFALQADGWYLRCDIIWHKPNPMPESVTDRPTKSHEYLFLLTKSERYFYDHEAIKEQVTGNAHARGDGLNPKANHNGTNGSKQNESFSSAVNGLVSSRNKRSVWTVTSAAYAEAHFATYPPALIMPCILAGTSAMGACAQCGAPHERVIEKGAPLIDQQRACGGDSNGDYFGSATKDFGKAKAQDASATKARILRGMVERKTAGWQPTCKCGAVGVVPCVVLDPFGGSGTTGQVALELARRAVLIELNPEYVGLIERRCDVAPVLALA